MNHPFVTIIIPCRNEQKRIEECLQSVTLSDYPKESYEVLVIDGMSTDCTRDIVSSFAQKHPQITLHHNERKIAAAAMNIGIKKAKGDIIMRMDAHTLYPKEYISLCVETLLSTNADNAGGNIETIPGAQTAVAWCIAKALSHPFGVGGSPFRTQQKTLREVDTVPFGCFQKDIFNTVGLFNERLIRSQDMEFNIRLKRKGGKIILNPKIRCKYHAPATFFTFIHHSFQDGKWAILPTFYTGQTFRVRHYVAGVFAASVLIALLFFPFFPYLAVLVLFPYTIGAGFSSLSIVTHNRKLHLLFLQMFIFFMFHFSYGIGSVTALLKIFTFKKE